MSAGEDTPERANEAEQSQAWDRLRALFEAALDIPTAERGAWLAGLELEAPLRAELEGLLDSFDPDASLEVEGLPRVAGVFAPGGPEPGDRVGPYAIEDRIGRGGMGQVFRARQASVGRDVALKLLNHPFPSRRAIQRFEVEAMLLARLNHPHIATVFEAGVVEAGGLFVPWYAMELIPSGQTLDAWTERRPELDVRLALFLQICAGVGHAHQRGVLHRDLKPHNILVNADGQAKLIDFGIAKRLDEDTSQSQATAPGQVVGTVAYMSPEQAAGTELDVRSDQYALGVVLYELLCGALPHDIEGLGVSPALLLIMTAPASMGALERAAVPGDLRAILTKVLARDPDDRYSSVAAFAEDLARFRAGEAILARPPRLSYVLRRWAERNPAFVALIAAAGLGVVVGVSGLVVGLVRADAALEVAQEMRKRAQQAEADAQWAQEFVVEMLTAPARFGGDPKALRAKLERVSAALDLNAGAAAEGSDLRPRLLITELYLELGDAEQAELELELARQLFNATTHPELEVYWPTYMRLHLEILVALERLDEAQPLALRSLDLHRQRYGDDDPRTWEAELGHARVLALAGKLEPARALLERVTRDCIAELGAAHPDTLEAEAELAEVLAQLGDLDGAERHRRVIWTGYERELGESHPQSLAALERLISTLIEERAFDQAALLFPELLETLRAVEGDESPAVREIEARYAALLRQRVP